VNPVNREDNMELQVAANYVKKSRRTLLRMIKNGYLPAYRQGDPRPSKDGIDHRPYLISKADLDHAFRIQPVELEPVA